MNKRIIYSGLGILILFILINSCVKETYDMDKLSTQASVNIGVSVPVVKGSLTLGNVIESDDTVRFLEDNSISIVFEQDSLFTFDVSDILDIPAQDEQNKIFYVGPLAIDDFSGGGSISLDEISVGFPPVLRAALEALDGGLGIFPAIPSLPGDSITIASFGNFAQVEFGSGTVTVTITNNLPVEISLVVALKNASDDTQIGSNLIFNNIPPGDSASSQIDLTGEIVSSSLIAELVSISSSWSPGPVQVSLANDNITVSVTASDLTVVRGQAFLPEQLFLSIADTIQFDLDDEVEITFMELITANINYTLESHIAENIEVVITLPASLSGPDTTRFVILLGASGQQSGQLSLDNTINDFSTDPAQPYNSIPFEYGLSIKPSGGGMVNFDLTDSVVLTYTISDIDFDYVEGYFGQHSFDVDADSIDLGLGEIEDNISGTFTLTNPKVNINYSNSVGVPVSLGLNLIGSTGAGETQGLNADSIYFAYPPDRDNSPVASTVSFNKDNTDIVELIEMRPGTITYSGGATVNPSGKQGGWDNFVMGESSVVASLEIEIPLEFRANNLTLQDTLENPLKLEDSEEDEDFGINNVESASLFLYVNNGFPLEIGFKIQLYDSIADQVLATLDVPVLFPAAPVDGNGVVTGPTEDTTSIVITGNFLENLEIADELIVRGSLNTYNSGAVKILTDYTIEFKLGVSTKVSYEFDFGESDDE